MIGTRATLATLTCLLPALHVLAQSQPATQPGGGRVVWEQSYTRCEHPQALRLTPRGEKGYRILGRTSWTKDPQAKINDRYGFEFFVLDVDRQGHETSVSTFEYIPRHREDLWDATLAGGDLFVVGSPGWFGRIDAQGHLIETGSKGFHNARCIVARPANRFLLGGSLNFKDAWIGEVDAEGKVLWDRTYEHGADESVCALATRPDGRFVLATASGKFNKFGQGPSELWLVACDAKGNQEHEAILKAGRLMPVGHPLLIPTGDGYAIAFTRTQLPGINRAPATTGPSFDCYVASFNEKLELQWERALRPTGSLWSLLVSGPGRRLVSIGGVAGGLSIVQLSLDGEPKGETVIPLDGMVSWPVDVIAEQDTLTLLLNCTRYTQEPEPHAEHFIRLVQLRL